MNKRKKRIVRHYKNFKKSNFNFLSKIFSKLNIEIQLEPGRFISGITNGIKIVGLCIPWRFAHVSTGRKDRKPWEDHLSFIQNLSFSNEKTIIIGDFNQNIPKKNQPEIVFSSLKNMIDGFNLLTTNMGLLHIVISNDLKAESVKKIATGDNSDHDGITCSIKFS